MECPFVSLCLSVCKTQIRANIVPYLGRIWPILTFPHSQSSSEYTQLLSVELLSTSELHFNRRNVLSLSLLRHYVHGKRSEQQHFRVPPVQSITFKDTGTDHPYSSGITECSIRTAFFFPGADTLWKRLLGGCFLEHYNLKLFKSRVNCCLSYMSS